MMKWQKNLTLKNKFWRILSNNEEKTKWQYDNSIESKMKKNQILIFSKQNIKDEIQEKI